MVIKDQNFQARNNYLAAQKEYKNSYDSSLKNTQDTFDSRIAKMSKNYADSKSKLEEENKVNKDLYEGKTQKIISNSQEEFRNKLKANADKFQGEMSESKFDFNNKLNDLSSSYRASAQEDARLNQQVTNAMKDRFEKTNSKLEKSHNDNSKSMAEDHKKNISIIKNDARSEKNQLIRQNALDFDNQRKANIDNKNLDIRRLKNENNEINETLNRENEFLQSRADSKMANLKKTQETGMRNSRENYQSAIDKIDKLNKSEYSKLNESHLNEIKNVQNNAQKNTEFHKKVAEQKIVEGSRDDSKSLSKQLKEANSAFNAKLRTSREEQQKANSRNSQEMQTADLEYRKNYKDLKNDFNSRISKRENEITREKNIELNTTKKNLNDIIETVKSNLEETDLMAAQKLNHRLEKNEKREKDQRIEFNKVVNHINDKNIDNLNSLKDDFSKDKTQSIEALKSEMAQEKMTIKNDFSRVIAARDSLHEKKLEELDKQNKKIAESYEKQISLIKDRSKDEVEAIRTNAELKSHKDAESTKLIVESIKLQKENEKTIMRTQYESVIEKNQRASEQKVSGLVKKYEDQITQLKTDHKKEVLSKVSEAESKYNRLSRNTQLNQTLTQKQYEQKLESVKLASNKQEHSKNS